MEGAEVLFLGMLFGVFGLAYFVYGRRQGALMPLVSGSALMIYPYFVDNLTVLIAVGIALLAMPFVIRF